ncbi:MAG: hypothetical protein MZW92_79390 [Comamonadaceae bacterium]|nr:hypothetical protein [Comamonadaceae bacterium]
MLRLAAAGTARRWLTIPSSGWRRSQEHRRLAQCRRSLLEAAAEALAAAGRGRDRRHAGLGDSAAVAPGGAGRLRPGAEGGGRAARVRRSIQMAEAVHAAAALPRAAGSRIRSGWREVERASRRCTGWRASTASTPEELPGSAGANWSAAATELGSLPRPRRAGRARSGRRKRYRDAQASEAVGAAARDAADATVAAGDGGDAGTGAWTAADFEVALEPLAEPAAYGMEAVEFRVAGQSGSSRRGRWPRWRRAANCRASAWRSRSSASAAGTCRR